MGDLTNRLQQWAALTPGVGPALELVVADGWLHNEVFVRACVVDIDEDMSMIDWVAVDTYVSDRLGVASLTEAHGIARRALRHCDPTPSAAPGG